MPWIIRGTEVIDLPYSEHLRTDLRATAERVRRNELGRWEVRPSFLAELGIPTETVDEEVPTYASNNLKAVAEAKASGRFRVIKSKAGTLLIDIDSKAAFRRFKKLYKMLKEPFALKKLDFYQSKSGEGWHVVLSTSVTNFGNRIALQAILGSDPVKEAFSIINMKHGELEACYLFKPLPRKIKDV